MKEEISIIEAFCIVWKRKAKLFSATLLGICLGLVGSCFIKPSYHLKAIISLPHIITTSRTEKVIIPISFVQETTQILMDGIKNNDYQYVQNIIPVPPNVLKNLKSIKTKSIKGRFAELEIVSLKQKGMISLLDKLVGYLNNLSYTRNKLKKEKKLIEKDIRVYSSKIPKMKDIISNVDIQIKRKKIHIIGFNPINMELDLAKTQQTLNFLKYQLENLEGYTIVSTHLLKEEPSRIIVILIGGILGFIAGMIIIFLKSDIDKEE
ncbi:Wzz/FepE/Etk N-terminal domain-containing protein [Desulfurobacterium sp.]|uniref:Wzz/FepE/Etk N-terminal domain-containing protein n=1 Tax=Desulfurobacterium sp. TaxID=2004706 RepID=UPI0026369A3F|nr:Wzz/FepE/Etk N-terminal domain-containing protein [Desulfurobacterium sp.]